MRKRTLLALALLIPLYAHAEMFKCVANGHTTFQDSPCVNGTPEPIGNGSISIYTPPEPSARPERSRSRTIQPTPRTSSSGNDTYQSTTERRNAEVRARTRGIVIPGMSERQAISILGEPSSTSTSTRSGRVCRYLRWNGSRPFQDGYHRVTICDGEVSSYSGR